MSRTIPQIFETLDNLAKSWATLGHPAQAKVQQDALDELRRLVEATPEPSSERRHRRR